MSFSGEFKTFVTQRAMGEIFNQLMVLIALVGIDMSPGVQGEAIEETVRQDPAPWASRRNNWLRCLGIISHASGRTNHPRSQKF
jgi:hypothetical protein